MQELRLQDNLTPPRVSPVSMPGNSQDLELIKLQIEKQRLETQVLELEAQAKARSLSSPGSVKPAAIPSLDTVRSGHNAGKSEGQLDHNTRITNPQEWPHLHVPFGLARKKFKDLTTSEFVYGYLDIVNSEPPEKQAVMTRHLMSLMQLALKYSWNWKLKQRLDRYRLLAVLNRRRFLRSTPCVPDTMPVSLKVNLTTTHASLIRKNGLICMSHSVLPGKSSKISRLLNSFTVI